MTDHTKHPLEEAKERGKERKKKAEKEKIHCPDCGTTVFKDSIEEAVKTAEKHDEMRHGGEQTAKVNGMLPPSDELVETVEEAVEGVKEGLE